MRAMVIVMSAVQALSYNLCGGYCSSTKGKRAALRSKIIFDLTDPDVVALDSLASGPNIRMEIRPTQ